MLQGSIISRLLLQHKGLIFVAFCISVIVWEFRFCWHCCVNNRHWNYLLFIIFDSIDRSTSDALEHRQSWTGNWTAMPRRTDSDHAECSSSSKLSCNFKFPGMSTLHRVSKNVPPLACYNFDAYEWILIFFGSNVTDKVGNQKTLYYATSNNLCFCATWQNAETRKSHISLNLIVLYTQCTCALSSWKKKLSSVMCLITSNICCDSKISH